MSERVPYVNDYGTEIGTCLPASAHQVVVALNRVPTVGVVCPDDGCVEASDSDIGCWLEEWVDEVGWDLFADVGPRLTFQLVDTGDTIAWQDGPALAFGPLLSEGGSDE